MLLLLVFFGVTILGGNNCNTVTSPQIRILDVATKESETRFIPHRVDYRNSFKPSFQQINRYQQNQEPLKSYVIYDEYPVKIFKEWKANFPGDFPPSGSQSFLDLKRQPSVDYPPDYRLQNGQQVLPPAKPTLAYRSVYSNVIKVFDNSVDDLERNRFQSERYIRPFEGGVWKAFQPPIDYEPIYPQEVSRRKPYQNLKLPENFPQVFSPDEKFHFSSFNGEAPKPPRFFYPQEGYYDTYTVNYNQGNQGHRDEVEVLPGAALGEKNQKKNFLCGFIRVNQRKFPENGGPCGRSEEDLPIVSPEYPEYFNLPSDKIPVEHRRQLFQIKRIKRSGSNKSEESRRKRDADFGYGSYGSWGSPFSYEGGYYSDNYPGNSGYGGYGGNYGSSYYRSNNRNRNQGYRNRYYGGSRSNYDEYDDEYQNNDDSGSRGLTGYLTNGGRRYKNRNNNDDEDNDDNNNSRDGDDDDNDNRNNDSDEEMERQNSRRRDANDRRNNDNNRNRRRNNNNNSNNNSSNNYNDDEDDYRDNQRRNNNRQNSNNSRRNNYNRRNNNNDRYGYNNSDRYGYNNRVRYYDNGYGNQGYGNSYGGNGYGGSYGSNGGYGSGYGNSGGYGYGGGYGNGFSSF